jgi:hypothetical protein
MTAKRASGSRLATIVLPAWLRWTIYASTAVLFITGVMWLVAHFGLRDASDDLPHPAEHWILRVHGFAMLVGLFVYGSLLRVHMINAWNMRRNRVTGGIVSCVLLILTLTGYVLYYGTETTRPVMSALHWVIGLAISALLPFHIWRGRKSRTDRTSH